MHRIIFYCNRRGESPVLDYMRELEIAGSKDSRIKATKIRDYVHALSIHGTYLPEKYVKHLNGDIWELRPLRDRILFAAWVNGAFVLLHCFVKKTQKTPVREIEKAMRELADFAEREKEL